MVAQGGPKEEAGVIRAMRRVCGVGRWVAMILLVVGSEGCSMPLKPFPTLDVTPSLPSFDAVGVRDLIPDGLSIQTEGASDYRNETRQEEKTPARPPDRTIDQLMAVAVVPALCSEDTLAPEICTEESPVVSASSVPSEAAPPVLAQVPAIQVEGPGELFRGPEPVQEEPYDPFQKEDEAGGAIEEYDPWEPFNQAMFTFNRKLDEYVVKPVATVYDKVMPDPLELGFRNAFHNIRFAPRFFNNLFQGKFKGAGIEAGSFLVNSTLGVAGFFNFSKNVLEWDTPDEDTGQTLGVFGAKPGPYLVLPFLGSFTLRDGIGFVGDLALDPFNWLVMPFTNINGAPQLMTNESTVTFAQLGTRAGYMVNERAINIETTFEGVEASVVDLYGAVRNAYLQKRAKAIRK
ncbi:MAG: VacJ family lipoprotein [Nitrospirae bacterium]|nr:MAG: VacJ family lipoprotein [Nitrospirota bacterium]